MTKSNPTGVDTLISISGCDSIVTIDLLFADEIRVDETYSGCTGDGHSITVNNIVYDESNPTGVDTLISISGCDSIVTIDLIFSDEIRVDETYSGCTRDGHSITVNNIVYDESNPTGVDTLISISGCDSIVTIDLLFADEIRVDETYSGCTGDGYSIIVNNVIYNEANPFGVERLTSVSGCDTLVYVDFNYYASTSHIESYSGCVDDGYEIVVNEVTYNEANPQGVEIIDNATGCDSMITISLEFLDVIEINKNYIGCQGDGYSVQVNGAIYNESNPAGTELVAGGSACDTLIIVNLDFEEIHAFSDRIELEQGETYQFNLSPFLVGMDTIIGAIWIPPNGVDCSTCISPQFIGDETTIFHVEIFDLIGCNRFGEIEVFVQSLDTFLIESIFVPNVFSPNNDGINDHFKLFTAENESVSILTVQIFNRWGDRVFERKNINSDDMAARWDGTNRGRPLSPGVYVYYVTLNQGEGNPMTLFGEVTLMK